LFERAIDFGWFFFLTKPIFIALDYLASIFGNMGVAIIVFTVMLKLVLFPLVAKSYRSMGRMRAVAPKVAALRERLKDDTVQQQKEIMALYKSEGVNPAAGCLPMLPQIPIFFSLYKVIFISIGMRHAPFVLWIHDLSAEDPTNIFNLFGLLPFHPSRFSPFLHLGVLPIIMGLTMWGQQKMNPPPPDPTQAKMMQFMPVIFTFMLGRFAAGLVLYYCVNNSLTILQQWLIMRSTNTRPRRPADAKA
jgi:protein translocase subunit yidC